jgi:uncharacterized RDD family membrane protein YckC
VVVIKNIYDMENRTKKTIIKRFLAFIFDFALIMLLSFVFYMLAGLIFKIDSEGFQNIMYPLLIMIISYMFWGELLFKNTLGKYLLGIEIVDKEKLERPFLSSYIKRGLLKILLPVEGLVLLFSKSKSRLGDLWANTIVVNKEANRLKPTARLIIGILILIILLFGFRVAMGLAVERTDFYKVGINYLKNNNVAEVKGLTKVVNQTRNTVNFIIPVSNSNQDKYAIIYLEKNGSGWSTNHIDFSKEHIIGFSYGFSFSSKQ